MQNIDLDPSRTNMISRQILAEMKITKLVEQMEVFDRELEKVKNAGTSMCCLPGIYIYVFILFPEKKNKETSQHALWNA